MTCPRPWWGHCQSGVGQGNPNSNSQKKHQCYETGQVLFRTHRIFITTFWRSVCLQVSVWKFMNENKRKISFWRDVVHLEPDEWLLVWLRITGFDKGFLATSLFHITCSNPSTEQSCWAWLMLSWFTPICIHPVFFRRCSKWFDQLNSNVYVGKTMKSNNFGSMQSYKLFNSGFMQNTDFLQFWI